TFLAMPLYILRSNKIILQILLPPDVKPGSIKPELIAGTNNLYATDCYKTISEAKYPFTELDVIYEHINNDPCA
ncbi:hypothetical protein, partial [Salmonella enterica]|uniref:hypothetical protein n=1 Tax=Salmonella enterica TaxID=28901 RepID=UPI001C56B8B7